MKILHELPSIITSLEKQKSEGDKVNNCHPMDQPPNGRMWSNEYS
uniref:Uncharacterized protein n=1 Tax=Arundo donax TaxID=35708 RepID=A0A0A9DH15_ARUDO